jgi:hypothetical protein
LISKWGDCSITPELLFKTLEGGKMSQVNIRGHGHPMDMDIHRHGYERTYLKEKTFDEYRYK